MDYGVSNNSPLCSGQDLIFNVNGGVTYAWQGPNGFTEPPPFTHIYHSRLADSGRYYVKIISAGGCFVTDSTDVIMQGVDVHLGADTAICKGSTLQLAASGGIAYQWSPVEGLSNSSVANPRASPQNSTTYTVNVKDAAGCTNAGSITIQLKNTVAVQAKLASPDFVCRSYDSATFTDQSLGKIVRWNWDFDNGQVSSSPTPPVQYYSIPGNASPFNIRLSVVDSAGCGDTIVHTLKIAENCYIAVPTAFSPNGDGINDYLYPLNAYRATQLIFRVFSRTGQLMFETRDWTKKWDGTFKGEAQSTDIFVWELSYTDAANKRIFLKGSTLLLR